MSQSSYDAWAAVGQTPALPSGCASRQSRRGAKRRATGSRGSWPTVPSPMRSCGGYLVQDYSFLDSFVRLVASAIVKAPSLADRIPLGRFLGAVSGEENTYFHRAFDALSVPEADRTPAHVAPDNARVPRSDGGCH